MKYAVSLVVHLWSRCAFIYLSTFINETNAIAWWYIFETYTGVHRIHRIVFILFFRCFECFGLRKKADLGRSKRASKVARKQVYNAIVYLVILKHKGGEKTVFPTYNSSEMLWKLEECFCWIWRSVTPSRLRRGLLTCAAEFESEAPKNRFASKK